jgi:hypothetical protein
VLQQILQKPETARTRYPAAMLSPRGRVIWFADKAAVG